MKTFNPVDVALDASLLKDGVYHYRQWSLDSAPHAICVGPTGSGKTSFVKLIIARLGLRIRSASVLICDFKADDFRSLRGLPNHFEFSNCVDGLDRYYRAFQARQSGQDDSRDFRLLVFDEWASFLNLLDKKEADSARTKLSTLLMLGRSFGFQVIISQQRADAENFVKGARDNFGLVVALGNISKESAAMFGFERNRMEPVSGIGHGYMLTNGTDMAAIQVPRVRDVKRMETYIRRVVARPL